MKRDTMFPHTITLYVTERRIGPEFRDEGFTNFVTVIRGVFVRELRGVNMGVSRETGAWFSSGDTVSVNIPASAEAADGFTGAPKRYAGAREWANASNAERESLWAAPVEGGNDQKAFFIVGEIVEPELDYAALRQKYDGVYQIRHVRDRRFGGLPQWEIGGV